MVRHPVIEVPPMTDDQLTAQTNTLADDLLPGARKIADFLGVKPREVYYLAATGRLPIGRLGRKLIASRAQLRRAVKALTAI
jgi:hypothetical protein